MTQISATITRTTEQTPPPAPQLDPARQWFRGLHVAEGGRVPDPLGSPGVIPPYNPTVALSMTRSVQLLSYDVMAHFHPAVALDRGRWRNAHGYRVAMNNGDQNGFDGSIPHIDYVTACPDIKDSYATLPRYDKMQRGFAGSLQSGHYGYSVTVAIQDSFRLLTRMVMAPRSMVGRYHREFQLLVGNNIIICEPGVDAIDARSLSYEPGTPEAASILQDVLDKRHFVFGVAETATGAFRIRDHWEPAGILTYLFILDQPVSYEARFFTPWDEAFAPDPLEVYL